jgi:hypothetical protein
MREQYLPGDFIACTGYLRSGKTMNAVRIAYALYKRGWNVVANFDVSFASQRLKHIEELYEVRKSVILFDEVQETLDSRDFKNNVAATQQGVYFGKRGNITIFTLPHFGMLDVRFRQLTQYVYLVRKTRYKGGYASHIHWCWYPGVGDILKPYGAFVMPHSNKIGALYNTLDENVKLVPRDAPVPKNKRNSVSFVRTEAQPSTEPFTDLW